MKPGNPEINRTKSEAMRMNEELERERREEKRRYEELSSQKADLSRKNDSLSSQLARLESDHKVQRDEKLKACQSTQGLNTQVRKCNTPTLR